MAVARDGQSYGTRSGSGASPGTTGFRRERRSTSADTHWAIQLHMVVTAGVAIYVVYKAFSN